MDMKRIAFSFLIFFTTVACLVTFLSLTRGLQSSIAMRANQVDSPKRFIQDQSNAVQSEVITRNGPTVRWTIDPLREKITFEVTSHELAPLGWIALGFPRNDSTLGNQMIGSDAVVSTMDAAGNANVRSVFLAAKVPPSPPLVI